MENKFNKKSLNPIINKNSSILILGSLPSDKSIEMKQYYGNPTNQFWFIMYSIFSNIESIPKSYEDKVEFLHKNNIALWDVFSHATRENSADANITNTEFNNVKQLLKEYPNIKKILLNGKAAESGFEKYAKENNIKCEYEYVPSSSGANAIKRSEKVECWKKAIEK